MILDNTLEFADATTVVGVTSTLALVGDVIPLSVARDVGGNGGSQDQMYLVVTVDTTITGNSVPSCSFSLYTHSAANVEAGVFIAGTGQILIADLVAGAKFIVPMPPSANYNVYLGVVAAAGDTDDIEAGKVNAFLTRDQGTHIEYSSPSQYL